jgi:superfamily II DNA helicase RecQ
MLESPSFARLIHSKKWQDQISGIYIDEAHLVQQSHSWRPSYSRLYQFRNIIGLKVPVIALSATCLEAYQVSLITYAGMRPNYILVNLGNFRQELSTIILPIKHESCLDLAFILPLGCRVSDLAKTIFSVWTTRFGT